jgi:urease accessory protein
MNNSSSSSLGMLRLYQLVSPALPVGAYNFSQGLEYAVHAGWVKDESTTLEWVNGIAQHSVALLDVPLLLRMQRAWNAEDYINIQRWNAELMASRESDELRAEERHMGRSLAKVLHALEVNSAEPFIKGNTTYACMFALATSHWNIDEREAAMAFLWAWCENQILAALKTLPIGQTAGQRMLNELLQHIPSMVDQAMQVMDEYIGAAAPRLSMASAWHETQYSRLFRS